MDFLKSQLDRIQQQLSGLNASQKMLAACLVAIIAMTVAWWGRRAGTSETTSLFQALDPAEASRIVHLLDARGIPAELTPDNRIHVPVAQVQPALGLLAVSEAMPSGPSIDFDSYMKGLNPFASQGMNDAHMNNFKCVKLAEVIRKGFADVVSAHVVIDATHKPGLNGTAVDPTATVHIETRGRKPLPQRLVDGAASLVLGSQAGLKWNRVQVLVNGAAQRISDPDTRGFEATDLYSAQQVQQKACEDRIVNALRIPGASVTVSFDVQPETVRTKRDGFEKDKSFTLEIENEEKQRESNGGAGGMALEPGVVPNGPMAVTPALPAGSGEQSRTESDAKSKFQAFPSRVTEERVRTAGLGPALGAAVLIPRSHAIQSIKFIKKLKDDPDEQQIQEWFAAERQVLADTVKTAAGLDSVAKVSLGLYADIPPQIPGAAGAAQAAGVSTASLAAVAGTHSREIMLGGLAVVSLFMVSMMVRKAGPAVAAMPVGLQQTIPMPVLDASEALAGEVSEGKSMLDAMELDEDAVRAQQMVDQVSAMVEDNPDAAAGLVKRWMSRT